MFVEGRMIQMILMITVILAMVYFISQVRGGKKVNIRSIPAFGTFLVLIQSIFISIAIARYNFLMLGVRETVNELFTQINRDVTLLRAKENERVLFGFGSKKDF